MVTDKQTYLRKLKRLLQWNLPAADAREALEDFSALFDEGLAAGQSEVQLCQDFGDPAQMAAGLVAEQPTYSAQMQLRRVILWILAGAVIFFLARLIFDYFWSFDPKVNWELLMPAIGGLTGFLAWRLCGGALLRSPIFARPKHRRDYLCWQVILPLFTLLSYQLLLVLKRYLFDNNVSNSGPILASTNYAIIFCHLLLAVYAVRLLLRGNIYMPAIIIQSVANLGIVETYHWILFSMDLENTGDLSIVDFFFSMLPNPLLCIGLGLALSAVFLFWLHWTKKGDNDGHTA